MVSENFEFWGSKMAKIAFEIFFKQQEFPQLQENIYLFPPQWLEKILEF